MSTDSSPACPLETTSFGLSHDPWGRLVLIDSEGERHIGVEPVRAFPISDPNHWISIVSPDGREVVCVRSIADVPKPTRQVLEQELSRREFVPVIQRIEHVSTEAEPSEWVVETDRGPTRFLVNSADEVRRLGSDSAIIVDMQGVRYLINSIRSMDAASRRILEHYF
jgi:hypothetical protein